MTRLVLVRHGEAEAGWGSHLDPGLSARGRAQAAEVAEVLAGLGPRPLVASPLRRTRETAAPLAVRWGVDVVIEPAVGEIESPTPDLAGRQAWLAEVMGARWPELPDGLQRWRAGVLAALRSLEAGAVVVTHFVAINVAVGAATGDDRVVTFWPDHTSRTVVDVDTSGFRLVEHGAQAVTAVR